VSTIRDTDSSRIYTLDVIRGVAVMGILAMNIVGFALPEAAQFDPRSIGMDSLADRLSWLVDFLFLEGRMRGLFSFLFGASMLLVIERADAGGQDSARIHFARMVWLLLFGLLHFYLIWWGDILAVYAMVGMIAWFFAYRSTTGLLQWGILLVFAQAAIEVQGLFADHLFEEPAYPSSPLAGSIDLYRGGFLEIAAFRIREQLFYPFLGLFTYGWETLGYMLLGMAALKSGILDGKCPRDLYVRIAAFGLGIGLPVYALLAWAQLSANFSEASIRTWNTAATVPVRPIMILGYAALIILLCRQHGPFTERIAAAGRAAFTNYLGTSLAMTFLFYGWGLGWFGTMNRAALWLVVLPMWALMLLWSKPWLDRFRYGPFEWLWRSLARWEVQPMRKTEKAA